MSQSIRKIYNFLLIFVFVFNPYRLRKMHMGSENGQKVVSFQVPVAPDDFKN